VRSFDLCRRGRPGSRLTPNLALFFANFSEAVAFGGERDLLVLSGRPGFHRSENLGERWRLAMTGFIDSAGVEPFGNGFCQAQSVPSTVYSPSGIPPGQPVFRTDDLGRRWRAVGSIAGETALDCAVDASNPDIVYVLARNQFFIGALFNSTDGGRTFVHLAGLPPLDGPAFVRTSPTQNKTVYVGNATGDPSDGIYVSHDGGATFARLPASPPQPFRLAAHPTQDGLLFVIGFDGTALVLFRSTDGGTTFAPTGLKNAFHVAFDPNDKDVVYVAASTEGLFRSSDSGVTFTKLAGPTPDQLGQGGVINVGVPPAHRRRTPVLVSTSRGPFRSDDGGNTFFPIHRDYHGASVNDIAIDAAGRLMVGALHTVVVFRAREAGHARSYDNFGANLTKLPATTEWDGAALAPSPVDANVVVVVSLGNGVYTTTDGGATWTRAVIPFDPFFGFFTRATFAPSSASRVYIITSRGFRGLYRSDDAGHSFKRTFAEQLGAIAVDPRNPDVLYVATFDNDHGIFKSVNGGLTLTPLGQPGRFSTLSIDPRQPETIYAGNRAGGVLRSLNGGATWADASTGLPPGENLAVAVDPQIPARVYAWVKAAGLFVSEDGAGSWAAAETIESVSRSGIEAGRAAMAVDRVVPGRVYIGNSGVVQIDTLGESEGQSDGD
jgi:photosystem II stability/assembly factor-like uncharacterized protein